MTLAIRCGRLLDVSGVYPHGLNGRQFASYVRLGMAPLDAIRSATTVAADCMGWSDQVGSLAAGRFDDVTELGRPVVVAKGGSVVLDRRIGAGAA